MKRYLSFLFKLIAHPDWFFARLRLLLSETPCFSKLRKLFVARSTGPGSVDIDNSLLVCIYDLEYVPSTFNIFEYLGAFSLEARSRGKRFFLLVVDEAIGKSVALNSFARAHNVSSREYRLRNIIAPACGLFPACAGMALIYDRNMIHSFMSAHDIFPQFYDPFLSASARLNIYEPQSRYVSAGRHFASLVVPQYALDLARQLVPVEPGASIVTVTLRASRYDQVRNSSLPDWSEFVDYAKGLGFFVVVIPDADNPSKYNPIPDECIYTTFCYNMELRAAIYELAAVNLGVANGPLILSSLNQLSNCTVALKVAPAGSETREMYSAVDVSPSDQYFWYNAKSKNYVEYDSFENIKYVFHQSLDFLP